MSAIQSTVTAARLGRPTARPVSRRAGAPRRRSRWKQIIWICLLGVTTLTVWLVVDPRQATIGAVVYCAVILLFGWWASLESLFLMLILVLPFDGLKVWQVLSLSNVLVFMVVIKGAVQVVWGQRRIYRSRIYLPMLAFAVAIAASCINAQGPALAWRLGFTIIGGMAVAVAALNVLDNLESLYRAVVTVLIAGVYVAVVGLFQVGLWVLTGRAILDLPVHQLMNLALPAPHLKSVFESEAIAGIYLVCATMCALTFALAHRRLRGGRRFAVLGVLLLVASVLTFSRALIVTYVVGLPVVIFAATRRSSWRLRPWMVIVVAPLLLAAAWKTVQLVNEWDPSSTLTRLALLRGSVASIAQHPFVGNGLGARVVPMYWETADTISGIDTTLRPDQLDEYTGRDAHNTYVTLLVNTGVFGLASFCWLLWAIWREGRRRSRIAGGDGRHILLTRGLRSAYLLTVVCIAFNGVIGVKAIWLVMGLAAAAGRVVAKKPVLSLNRRWRDRVEVSCESTGALVMHPVPRE